MTNVASITIDGRFIRHQLEHGLVIAAAVAGHDRLILAVPRAGRTNVLRVEWPGIRNVAITGGAITVTDADCRVTMPDLHSHLLTGSLGDSPLTRDDVTARVSNERLTAVEDSRSGIPESDSTGVPIAPLCAGFGLAARWTVGGVAACTTPVPVLPTFRAINPDAFDTDSTRTILVLDGGPHGRGHMYIEGAPFGSTVFAVGAVGAGGCYFVTGPQRSGTTFLAHAISYDLGIQHIDEVDFQTFDYAQFRELAARSRHWVVQAPALFHHLAALQNDFPTAIPVVVRRRIEDIVASQRRINWGVREEGMERRHLGIPESDRRPIAEIKYAIWDRDKQGYRHFVEVPYDDLRQHPLYVETRSDYGAKRWS
jgi:hypothetical protein